MALPERRPDEIDEITATQRLAYSDECIRTCPQLHQKTQAALMRFALEGGELIDFINQEIEQAKANGELPEHCELGPTTVSERDHIHGTPVSISGITASYISAIDRWKHPHLGVCRSDRERIMQGNRTSFYK